MKLRYTLRGAAELDEIFFFIAERSPQGARSVKARIQAMKTRRAQIDCLLDLKSSATLETLMRVLGRQFRLELV